MSGRRQKKQEDPGPTLFEVEQSLKRLPKSVRVLINGNVIDLSGASAFYKKKAEIATLLQDFIERRSNSRYALKNEFDRYFLRNLPMLMGSPRMRSADALADALFMASRQCAKIDYGRLPLATTPTEEFLRSQWKTSGDWDSFLRTQACVGEVWWHNLGPDGKVQKWAGASISGDFALHIAFSNNTIEPPAVAIGIKGEPAEILMTWWMAMEPNSAPDLYPRNEALRERTATLLDSLLATLKMNLKLLRRARGRPRDEFGERAAYLLDHEKRSLGLIAKQLCQMPEQANPLVRRQYFDRIRKAVKNYYKILRSDHRTLTGLRLRQRIILIPANPNAVKSE